MAEAKKTLQMNVSPEKLWAVITDYESYSQFVEGVSEVKILSREKDKVRAQYKINLLGKDIVYVLDHVEEKPKRMRWSMVESNIFKSNQGGWDIRDLGNGKIEVDYQIELDFKIFVPGMILNGLVKSTLPKMMSGFEERAKK